jgi:hypothetical protein
MLNEKITERLTERLVSRIENINSYILQQIGKQILIVGSLTPTKAYEVINMLKYGGDYDKIINELARITNMNIQDIYNIFEEVAKYDYNLSRELYEYRNIKYIPYEENIALQQRVNAIARATANTYINLSGTLGFNLGGQHRTIRDTYVRVIDEAIYSLGTMSYNEVMKKTIKELGEKGLRTVDYSSGYSRRLDSSVRMNIMDAIGNLHNEVQRIIGEEVKTDGIEISVHENPAEDHKLIQGRQYSNEAFEKLNSELERPISTLNCNHYIFSIILGLSEPRYTEQELQEIINNNEQGFSFDGKRYTLYQGQQMQRRLETEIRKQKDLHTIATASVNNELIAESQTKIRHLAKKYKELSEVSGLPTKVDRLKVEGFKRVNLKELK